MFTINIGSALAQRPATDSQAPCENHAHDDSPELGAVGCSLPLNHAEWCESHGTTEVTVLEPRDVCRSATCAYNQGMLTLGAVS